MDLKTRLRAQWDRALAVTLILIGALALLFGWIGISTSALSYQQLPYLLSGGLFGVVLIGVGSTLLLSADLRDEWRQLASLEDAVRQLADQDALVVEEPALLVADKQPRRRPARSSAP
jgi:hypothetical protein